MIVCVLLVTFCVYPHTGHTTTQACAPQIIKSSQCKINATIAIKSRFPFTDVMVYPPGLAFGDLLVSDHYYRRPCFVWMVELACRRHFPGRLHCPVCKSIRGSKRKEWCSRRAILRDGPCDIIGIVYKCIACAKGKPKVLQF